MRIAAPNQLSTNQLMTSRWVYTNQTYATKTLIAFSGIQSRLLPDVFITCCFMIDLYVFFWEILQITRLYSIYCAYIRDGTGLEVTD